MGFEVYRSSNNIKRRPDDSLLESECARFKVSEKDFAIIHLTAIKRWLTISPCLQFNIYQDEKTAIKEMDHWEQRVEEAIHAKYLEMIPDNPIQETTVAPGSFVADDGSVKITTEEIITGSAEQEVGIEVPEEMEEIVKTLKELVPDRWPGRTPTISLLDPEGGIWTTTKSRTVSSSQPMFCPRARFDLPEPELYYQRQSFHYEGVLPSEDAATHAYFYAGLDFIGAALTISLRVRNQDDISLITDGDLLLSDLSVADFILGRIIDENAWKDKSKPFVAALGRVNSVVLCKDITQLAGILNDQFFVGCE